MEGTRGHPLRAPPGNPRSALLSFSFNKTVLTSFLGWRLCSSMLWDHERCMWHLTGQELYLSVSLLPWLLWFPLFHFYITFKAINEGTICPVCGLKFQLCLLTVLWSWVSYLIFLCLGSPDYKMKLIIMLPWKKLLWGSYGFIYVAQDLEQ